MGLQSRKCLLALMCGMASASASAQTDVIDFEDFNSGDIVSQVFGAGGTGPINVNGFNPFFGMAVNAAMIFDSDNPTGDDPDLGTPNETAAGPGMGSDGEVGMPFANLVAQHNLLIISEDLDSSDPDDGTLVGNLYTFDFSGLGGATIHSIVIIDVEASELSASVEFYDSSAVQIGAAVFLPHVGDNGIAEVDLGDPAGVYTMLVHLNGSGAIDDIVFTIEEVCDGLIGDFVWLDENCDGIQDPGEHGIRGVTVELRDNSGGLLQTTRTNVAGSYSFSDLCADRYQVCVITPNGLVPSPCDVKGVDDALDSDCSCHSVDLGQSEVDRTVDFGFCAPPAGGEGCTPGYWKQPQHFFAWPAPYDPSAPDATLFSDVFDDAFPGMTLLDVLKQGGGQIKALGRHTVAALLNSAQDGVNYDLTPADVISMFNNVFPGSNRDYQTLKNIFESFNEQNCPLGIGGSGGSAKN